MQPRPKTTITPVEAVEIGRNLMALKAVVIHGDFIPRLHLLGYSKGQASRFMKAARKFHGAGNALLLDAVETVSKMNELLTLEDDEIDTLRGGGEAHGLTLASIKTMTMRELRAAIRGVSEVGEPVLLSTVEARFLRAHRENTRTAQDVPDKHAPAMALVEDLFSSPPAPPVVEIPLATGFHVAGLQFINPMGTWRMACPHVNQGTRYANVTFRPAPARAGYRAALG